MPVSLKNSSKGSNPQDLRETRPRNRNWNSLEGLGPQTSTMERSFWIVRFLLFLIWADGHREGVDLVVDWHALSPDLLRCFEEGRLLGVPR